jgi:hypothetical protein
MIYALWYLSIGLSTLFWCWKICGKPDGNKPWHFPANVFVLIFLWPAAVVSAVMWD